MDMKIFSLLTVASVAALMAPQMVYASEASDSQESASDVTDNSGIAEIVVTAQKRSESVQRSSLAIEVVGAKELERAGVSQSGDLTRLVPGLQVAQVGITIQPYIRGVGNASNTGQNDSGVAFNIDGIYIGQPVAYGLDFYDLSRIEVLKGPQGTLYGRNATGGAINLIPNNPGSEPGGYVVAEYGNYDSMRVNGATNVPLADDLSARLAFNIVERDGYYRDGSSDDSQRAARLRVKYSPESFTALVNLQYAHAGGVGGGSAIIDGALSGGQKYNLVNARDGAGSPTNLALYSSAKDKTRNQFQDIDSLMANAQFDIDLGSDIVLTLQPAYRDVSVRAQSYQSGFLALIDLDWKQFTMESRISRSTDKWKWVIGAYYYNQTMQGQNQLIDTQLLPPGSAGPLGTGVELNLEPTTKVKSYSLFGETTYSLTEQLRLIAGLRYTSDKTNGYGKQTFFEQPFAPCSALVPCIQNYAVRLKANNVSWKAGTEYDLTPSSMLFATASTGFKAGGVFPASAPRNNFKPEKLLAFEVGSRNRFLGNRLQVNLEGFYWRYDDKQETIAGFDSCGGPVCPAPLNPGILSNLTINAGRARIYGGSADVLFRATQTTTLHANAEYANGKYTDFTYQLPTPPNTGCVQSPPDVNGLFTVNCNGLPLTRGPKWTVGLDGEQVIPLGDGKLTLGAGMVYTSSRYIDAHFLGSTLAPGYALFNADVTYNAPGNRLAVTAFIKNIGNTLAAVTGYSQADNANQPFTSTVTLQAPRTYGLRLRYDF
jgi:iron complex outermembrane recepter protein